MAFILLRKHCSVNFAQPDSSQLLERLARWAVDARSVAT